MRSAVYKTMALTFVLRRKNVQIIVRYATENKILVYHVKQDFIPKTVQKSVRIHVLVEYAVL